MPSVTYLKNETYSRNSITISQRHKVIELKSKGRRRILGGDTEGLKEIKSKERRKNYLIDKNKHKKNVINVIF